MACSAIDHHTRHFHRKRSNHACSLIADDDDKIFRLDLGHVSHPHNSSAVRGGDVCAKGKSILYSGLHDTVTGSRAFPGRLMFYRATSEIRVGSWRMERARAIVDVDDVINATQTGAENIQMTSHATWTDEVVRCWRYMQMVRVEERILSTEFKLKGFNVTLDEGLRKYYEIVYATVS